MGNFIGKVYWSMTRPIRNVNIEQRVHKVISKEKPTPAPKYESTLRQIELAEKVNPGFMEKQKLKDPKLDKYLKDVYVTSKDPVNEPDDSASQSNPLKSLPTSRKTFEFEDMNYYYVNNVKEGKCSLEQLQTFLSKYANDQKKYNADFIAEQYQLDKKVVDNILKHYSIFRISSAKQNKEKIGFFRSYIMLEDEKDNVEKKKES